MKKIVSTILIIILLIYLNYWIKYGESSNTVEYIIALISIWVFFESMAVAIDSIQVGEVWESGDGFLYVWPSRLFVPIGVGAMGFSLVVDTIKLGCRLFGSDSNIHPNNSN